MRVGVIGCAGRMGRAVLREVLASPELELAGGIERPGHPCLGQDLGVLAGERPLGLTASENLPELLARAQVVVEFSSPEASVRHAEGCAHAGVPAVIGTTGFDTAQEAALARAAAGPLAVELAPGTRVNMVVPDRDALPSHVEAAARFLEGARSTTGQVLDVSARG